MKRLLLAIVILSSLFDVAQGGDVAKGKAKASACTACHGANGVSANPAWPNLAGQKETYFINAIKAYKSATRQDAMMAPAVKGLSDADIADLAAYYASLSCK